LRPSGPDGLRGRLPRLVLCGRNHCDLFINGIAQNAGRPLVEEAQAVRARRADGMPACANSEVRDDGRANRAKRPGFRPDHLGHLRGRFAIGTDQPSIPTGR
jgi:hypothetical protein